MMDRLLSTKRRLPPLLGAIGLCFGLAMAVPVTAKAGNWQEFAGEGCEDKPDVPWFGAVRKNGVTVRRVKLELPEKAAPKGDIRPSDEKPQPLGPAMRYCGTAQPDEPASHRL